MLADLLVLLLDLFEQQLFLAGDFRQFKSLTLLEEVKLFLKQRQQGIKKQILLSK